METTLGDSLRLKRWQADVAVGALPASPIVTDFNVPGYHLTHCLPGGCRVSHSRSELLLDLGEQGVYSYTPDAFAQVHCGYPW